MTIAEQMLDRLLEDPEVREGFDEQGAVVVAGKLVRDMRGGAGLSQRELAERIGTSQAHLSMIERGVGRYGPTFVLLNKIARICGLELQVTATPLPDTVDPGPAPVVGVGMIRRVTSLLGKGAEKGAEPAAVPGARPRAPAAR